MYPMDLDSVGITKIVAHWLQGSDPIAMEAGPRLVTGTWEFAQNSGSGWFTPNPEVSPEKGP